ncbi:MAG TPA: hypothetical protein VEQ59_13400, partial [Polyangiaceae bacterium]|nr:hypothetical protein [Polyangiaceae bacterium]
MTAAPPSPPKPATPPAAVPPPLPPRRASSVAARALSEGQKEALAIQALGLLNEQVQARIVHYKSELQTSPELDAITAQVVAQLKAMQAAVASDAAAQKPPEETEEQQTRILAQLLPRFFTGQTQFATRILKPIGKKIAKLFFESELHEKTKGDKDKVIHHPE